MKKIKLTKNKYTIVDNNIYKWAMNFNWSARKADSGSFYATRRKGKTSISLHREIMKVSSFKQIDHINGNTLDNRKCNLRICSRLENSKNRKQRSKNNSSGYKGVHYLKKDKKWMSRIMSNKKRIYLGTFDTAKNAAKAYNIAAKKYHKKFARLNKIY